MQLYETNIARLAYQKSLHGKFPVKVAGRITQEKVNAMRASFLKWLEAQSAGLRAEGLCKKLGIMEDENGLIEHSEVIEPANFKNHDFVASVTGELLARGFHVGRKVALQKRMSTYFGEKYIDINVKEAGFVKGICTDGEQQSQYIVVEFSKEIFDKKAKKSNTVKADVKVKVSNLKIVDDMVSLTPTPAPAASGTATAGSKVPKAEQFLLMLQTAISKFSRIGLRTKGPSPRSRA